MVSTVSWTNFAIPSTLVNVGSEAVCMLCDNILCFRDLNTNKVSYYKAESSELGLSIEAMSGHNKFALVAFSEVILTPAVHIIQYPIFTKYAVFKTKGIINFVDMRFNDCDLLLALSGWPNYTFCIWNFRTEQLLVKFDTFKPSAARSILCSFQYTPQIVQFSEWNRQILVWELCFSAKEVDLHEVSKIDLPKQFTYSNILSMCYGEDNRLYVVDSFANVFKLSQFYLEPQWSITDPKRFSINLKFFRIESHKQGLLVYSNEIVYYLRKSSEWQCEWRFLISDPPSGLYKIISNNNGEIYASAPIGNLYHIEVINETIKVNPLNNYNENSIDFVILKGAKGEFLIQLATTHYINAFALTHFKRYSRIQIPYANTIVAHNLGPYLIVGSSDGKLHFLNYSSVKQPFIITTITAEKSYPVGAIYIQNEMAVYRSIYNDFHLIRTDFTENVFYKIASFECFTEKVGINQYFLIENRIFIFINRNSDILIPHANQLCCYEWMPKYNQIERLEFNLPYTYRDVGISTVPMKDIVEFVAARFETCILDCLQFKTDTNEFSIVRSLITNHLCNINGIVSSTNLLTWAVDGTFLHFRMHRKSTRPYGISEILQIKFRPKVVQKVMECYMNKYLIYMYGWSGIKVIRAPTAGVPTVANTLISESRILLEPELVTMHKIVERNEHLVIQHSPEDLKVKDTLLINIGALGKKLTNLINYDISVTGKAKGVYKKFCLNHKWLSKLNDEAGKLCKAERDSLEAVITDQSRIRDWIYFIITNSNTGITFKLRAIFSHFSLENFGMRKPTIEYTEMFDLYRFYEMNFVESEDVEEVLEEDEEDPDPTQKELKELLTKKKTTYLNVQGNTYEHITCKDFAMQDVDTVTCNQMNNHASKIRILLTDRLKFDFNKKFEEIRQIKSELLEAILATNSTLTKIYSNMNCMLKLLGRPELKFPPLSIPEWQKDEFAKNLIEVDDSEIKAVNRRKQKAEATEEKQGRWLLWSVDFWVRALIAMMDGVLEKLWEEEIKRDIPLPEFVTKKDPAEYTLEDQRALKEYERKCIILEQDRKKYLSILKDNEIMTNQLKTTYILKLNENVSELMITKLKYDFAIAHVRLRNFNTKSMYSKKLKWLKTIKTLRGDIDSHTEYLQKYSKLHEFWTQTVYDLRFKVENLTRGQKTLERQFRSQILNSIPLNFTPEIVKLFKTRPKIPQKLLNSHFICRELSIRANSKSKPKYPFPFPKDVFDYLDNLDKLDKISNMPANMDPKYWDQFVKLRRQKVEMELGIKGVNLQLTDGCSGMNLYKKELDNLKEMKMDAMECLQQAHEEYLNSVQDQTLELCLTMSQVEVNFMGSLKNLENSVLIHQNDIDDINALIIKAGQRKIKAMQKVALFRRQVTYKEWQHKVQCEHIEYLKYTLHAIEKCKVSIEFLNLIRNWEKVRLERPKMLNTEDLLEKVIEQKLINCREDITRINNKISQTREKIENMKHENKRINRQIGDLKMVAAFSETKRDRMMEEKKKREQIEKMEKIKRRSNLIHTVRRDYVRIMELKTIFEIQRLRTYPTLGPNLSDCLTLED